MTDVAQKHAIDVQLLSIRCGVIYGALALGGLIATHLMLSQTFAALGALLACAGALFAYANFSLIAGGASERWISGTQMLSILCGVLSGVLVIADAI